MYCVHENELCLVDCWCPGSGTISQGWQKHCWPKTNNLTSQWSNGTPPTTLNQYAFFCNFLILIDFFLLPWNLFIRRSGVHDNLCWLRQILWINKRQRRCYTNTHIGKHCKKCDSKKDHETTRIKLRDLLEKGGYKGTICRSFYSLSKPQQVQVLSFYMYTLRNFQSIIIVSDVIIK